MIADKRMENFYSFRSILSLPFVPLQYAVSGPIQCLQFLKQMVAKQIDLIHENNELKANQLILKTKLQKVLSIESENTYLKALLHSSKKVDHKTLVAELLAVTSEPFLNQVVIDKGMRDGVYIGQPVLDANGVMGQVVEANQLTSRVLLINDPHAGIALQNGRNSHRVVALGDGYTGKLKLLYVSKSADINIGDLFITSGLGDHYPAGYPVGKVISILKDPTHQFADVILEPHAELYRSRQVLLVWYRKNV